jgi:hypothetical protein
VGHQGPKSVVYPWILYDTVDNTVDMMIRNVCNTPNECGKGRFVQYETTSKKILSNGDRVGVKVLQDRSLLFVCHVPSLSRGDHPRVPPRSSPMRGRGYLPTHPTSKLHRTPATYKMTYARRLISRSRRSNCPCDATNHLNPSNSRISESNERASSS